MNQSSISIVNTDYSKDSWLTVKNRLDDAVKRVLVSELREIAIEKGFGIGNSADHDFILEKRCHEVFNSQVWNATSMVEMARTMGDFTSEIRMLSVSYQNAVLFRGFVVRKNFIYPLKIEDRGDSLAFFISMRTSGNLMVRLTGKYGTLVVFGKDSEKMCQDVYETYCEYYAGIKPELIIKNCGGNS